MSQNPHNPTTIVILFATEIPASMDTTRLSDREINMLTYVIYNKMWSNLQLHLFGTILNIPLNMSTCPYFYSELDIKSMFYVYNTSGRFSRTFLGDSFAVVFPDEIEMIQGILRNG